MSTYSYARTAGVRFEDVYHNALTTPTKLSESYRALHSFKAGLDAMEEIPADLMPLYQQVMKALDKLVKAQDEAHQLAEMTRKTVKTMFGR